MSNTRRLGVWMGRTMPAFRSGGQRTVTAARPRQLPLARYGNPAPQAAQRDIAVMIPEALRRSLRRGDR